MKKSEKIFLMGTILMVIGQAISVIIFDRGLLINNFDILVTALGMFIMGLGIGMDKDDLK